MYAFDGTKINQSYTYKVTSVFLRLLKQCYTSSLLPFADLLIADAGVNSTEKLGNHMGN